MKLILFANNAVKGLARLVRACLSVSCALAIAGCSMDSVELGEYVRREMQEELVKDAVFKGLKMTSVRLVKTEGVEYVGVGKGEIGAHPVKFEVKCKYDGKTVIWDASLVDDNLLTLAGKSLGDKVKSAWPGVKKDIAEKSAAASKKMGEYFDTAKQKASELLDDAKEKTQKAVNGDE